MKKLLQNKRFRQNLYKWVFMYVCVMAIFTTVVTYSKYISSMGTDETARVASFEVGIDFGACPEENKIPTNNADGTKSYTCDMGVSRPTSILSYNFSVDTTLIEADALLVLTTLVADDFNILDFENVTTHEKYIVNGVPQSGTTISTVGSDRKVLISKDVLARQGTKDNYVIKIQYGKPIAKDDMNLIFTNSQSIVTIGYSATQKTN